MEKLRTFLGIPAVHHSLLIGSELWASGMEIKNHQRHKADIYRR